MGFACYVECRNRKSDIMFITFVKMFKLELCLLFSVFYFSLALLERHAQQLVLHLFHVFTWVLWPLCRGHQVLPVLTITKSRIWLESHWRDWVWPEHGGLLAPAPILWPYFEQFSEPATQVVFSHCTRTFIVWKRKLSHSPILHCVKVKF